MQLRVSTALVLGSVFLGCGLLDPVGRVEVRLENSSPFAFDEALLYLWHGTLPYTDVGPGAATPYVKVDTAYRFATTQVVIGSDTLRYQVEDVVGEVPLDGGRYSYVMSVRTHEGRPIRVAQELRRDQ